MDIEQEIYAKLQRVFHLRQQGNYEQATLIAQQVCDVLVTHLGDTHPLYAAVLYNLAGLYEAQGRYSEAEPLYVRSLSIREQQLEADHPDVANSLNNLANLHYSQGRYSEAEPLLRRSLFILEQQLGADHPDVATSLNGLANLYRAQGRYSEAEPLLRRSLSIYKQQLRADHPDVAQSLNNLAVLYYSQGRYSEAEPLYVRSLSILEQQSLAIREQQLRADHPNVATSLNNLANFYISQGRYSEAEPLYMRSLSISEQQLGADHPNVATSLRGLAIFQVVMDRTQEGLQQLDRARKIQNKMLGQIFSASTDRQRLEYLQQQRGNVEILLSLAVQDGQTIPEAVSIAFQQVLHYKALGTEAGVLRQAALVSGQYPHLAPELEDLQTLDREILSLTYALPNSRELSVDRDRLDALNQKREDLDRRLCRQIPEMDLQKQLETVDIPAITKALHQGSVLVEFVYFDVYNFKAVPAGDSKWSPAHYAAFVVSAHEPEKVTLIDLGEAIPINLLTQSWRKLLAQSEKHTSETTLPDNRALKLDFSTPPPKPELEKKLGQLLYESLIMPLEPYLRGHQQIFLAPDGELSCLPFHALPASTRHYLMEEYNLHYLSAGRDLLRFQTPPSRMQPTQPLVIADPDYDWSVDKSQAPISPDHSTLEAVATIKQASDFIP